MELEIVTKENLEQAIKAQNQIFANKTGFDDGTTDFIKGLSNKPDKEFNFIEHYLAKDKNEIVGCSGLYSYHNNPTEAWLSWFGVMPNKRKNGYGEQILKATSEIAKQKGFTALRLYTSGKVYGNACKLYEKFGFVGEKNKSEHVLNAVGFDERVYSMSLTDKPIQPWNNKPLHILKHELFDSILLSDKKKQALKDEILKQ